jgi:hypothetical protein
MSLTKISNLFNQLCQTHPDVKYYHYGWQSDINITVPNNFTLGSGEQTNPRGKKYPSLTLEFPSERWELGGGGSQSFLRTFLIFNDTQRYNSEDGSNNPKSLVEQQDVLKKIAVDIITNFNRIGRAFGGKKIMQIRNINNVIYSGEARADRLVELVVDLEIYYFIECSSFIADIENLPPPFNTLPPTGEDMELKKPL